MTTELRDTVAAGVPVLLPTASTAHAAMTSRPFVRPRHAAQRRRALPARDRTSPPRAGFPGKPPGPWPAPPRTRPTGRRAGSAGPVTGHDDPESREGGALTLLSGNLMAVGIGRCRTEQRFPALMPVAARLHLHVFAARNACTGTSAASTCSGKPKGAWG
jgi:hypothetical protein